ncbi:hypothetical protein [Streptomyces sp. L7]|uniref:hypothetical protein n=1 Tax=Streptomyces sp. L7 TaxID=3423954 RepID=UPI003D96B080
MAAELGVTHAAVSLARNEAMKLLHEGWLLHFDRDAGVLPLPDRNPRTKRSAYLAKLAEFTAHPPRSRSGSPPDPSQRTVSINRAVCSV